MMEGFTIIQHNREKDPVDNKISEAICSALQETHGNNSKPVCLDSFAGVGGFELSLDEKGGSFRGLFKNKDELYEALDDLDENNLESSACIESKIEIILLRMFPSDYSSSSIKDGIITDDFDKPLILVDLDEQNKACCIIDSDGMLKSKENPDSFKDVFSKKRKLRKDYLRGLLKQIAKLNSDINDLAISNPTSYEEYKHEIEEVKKLKEIVWREYCDSYQIDDCCRNMNINQAEHQTSASCNNLPKKQKGKKKRKTVATNNMPLTVKYYSHGNNSLVNKQRRRVNLLYKKWTEWGWIDPDTKPEDFDRFFEGTPRHCNIVWKGTTTMLTILLQELLKQEYIEKQSRCSPRHLVIHQFGIKCPNWDRKRLKGDDNYKIWVSLCILNIRNPLLERSDRDEETEYTLDATLYAIYENEMRLSKSV